MNIFYFILSSELLELKLQMVVSAIYGCWELNRALCRRNVCPEPLCHPSRPISFSTFITKKYVNLFNLLQTWNTTNRCLAPKILIYLFHYLFYLYKYECFICMHVFAWYMYVPGDCWVQKRASNLLKQEWQMIIKPLSLC